MSSNTTTKSNYFSTLKYFRNSIIESERRQIKQKPYFNAATKIAFKNLMKGHIDTKIAAKLVDQYNRKLEKESESLNPKISERFEVENKFTSCPVLICPIKLLPKNKKESKDPVTPLWLPANLNKAGCLKKPDEDSPWIDRDYLFIESSNKPISNQKVLLGSVEQEELYLAKHPFHEIKENWKSYIEWTLNYLEAFKRNNPIEIEITTQQIEHFQVVGGNHYLIDDNSYILLDPNPISGVTAGIYKLYKYLLRNRVHSPTLHEFCDNKPKSRNGIKGDFEINQHLTLHTGQMNGEYSLAKSQRQALHHSLSIDKGEILAVNGPPGTGKTTLLQSIIANLFVNKALAEGDPPVVIASSANNQAITNIIKSFENDRLSSNLLNQRWLPDPVSSYALYCVSSSKKKEAEKNGFLCINYKDEGLPDKIETSNFVSKAEEYFKHKAEEHFGQSFTSIKQIKELLHDKITSKNEILNEGKSLLHSFNDNNNKEAIENREDIELLLEKYRTAQSKVHEKIQNLSVYLDKLKSYQQEWEQHYHELPFYVRWLSNFISTYNRQVVSHNQYFFKDIELAPETSDLNSKKSIVRYFLDQINHAFKFKNDAHTEAKNLNAKIKKLNQLKNWFQGNEEVKDLKDLDTTIRFKMFKLATHYWEARWLQEAKKYNDSKRKTYSQAETEQKWRRYAMLTPCFVSTFYMAPKFFNHWEPGMDDNNSPLSDFADLLIVDEAGQVPAEIGAATFALAQKALVVGDTYQIQPIWSINKTIDYQNFNAVFQNDNYSYDEFRETGKNANGGSIMRVAQKRSPYKIDDYSVGGMLLTEHWRCVPEVIDYCNTLVYKNKLIPQLELGQAYHLPRFGFAHISGESKKDRTGSRYNKKEAKAIVQWIVDHKDEIIRESNKGKLKNIIAIVTPFRKQAEGISERLKRKNKELEEITVGTVHALQGAEREIIIFSTVYSQQDPTNYFFDQDVMMLNVAVSRAKKSFLVFGDMHIFDLEKNTPSGVLAKYLFSDYKNELTDVEIPKPINKEKQDEDLILTKISKPNRHCDLLKYCFDKAQNYIIIASPFVATYAVESDNMLQMIMDAIKRGVEVTCYIDVQLNCTPSNELKPSAKNAIEMLKGAGAIVKMAKNFHNKTLCADNFVISEGSFNWLSAHRKRSDKYQRYERSFVYLSKDNLPNKTINSFIQGFIEDMESRI